VGIKRTWCIFVGEDLGGGRGGGGVGGGVVRDKHVVIYRQNSVWFFLSLYMASAYDEVALTKEKQEN
jgi:hypothetical protein